MSLVQDIQEVSMTRVAAISLAAAFTLGGLSGCANIERVGSYNLKRGSYDARSAVKGAIQDETRLVACPVGAPQPQPRDDSLLGKLGSIWDRETTITTVPMTQKACAEAQQQQRVGPGYVSPRPRY